MKNRFFCKKKTINIQGKILSLEKPLIMGILNTTPDSFYDGGKHLGLESQFQQAQNMLQTGADIIDIGGYSTRPGASEICENEEIERVIPIITKLKNEYPECVISIDTFRAIVAEKAVEAGANMINDIAGGALDEKMFETVAKSNVPYIMMHSKGNPQTMQNLTEYKNFMKEIIEYFATKLNKLQVLGVKDVILDPGFGFAKTLDQNYYLLQQMHLLAEFEYPILAGISRKSMIYKHLNTIPENSLNGTTALNMLALQQGADILRVHDVKEAVETRDLFLKFKSVNLSN